MKFIKISIVIFVLASLFCIRHGFAIESSQSYQMMFWYPGEAGTTADAQATLDFFFGYINKQLSHKVSGKYFNNVSDGLKFVNQSKLKFAIISLAAYETNKDKLKNSSIFLKTLPLPDGKPYETYSIVGRGPMPNGALNNSKLELFSRQPLTSSFVNKYLIKNSSAKITTVPNILPLLKELASGQKKGAAILQPMEYFTLKNMNQAWAKELTVWHTQSVPSAPFLIFGEQNKSTDQIKSVLLKMNKDPEGNLILETLRLKGFAE